MDILGADISQCVRRQGWRPDGRARLRRIREVAALEHDVALAVVTDEFAPTHDIEVATPNMDVNVRLITRKNPRLQHPEPIVLQQHFVVFRGSGDSI